MDLQQITFRYARGKGPGGQHKNKTASRVTATHGPTGISVTVDGRDQHANKRKALEELSRRLVERFEAEKAARRKANRDAAIKSEIRVRTYDYTRQRVIDHRTKKQAPLKEVLFEGRLELVQ